jgi:exosome complex exonuclease RRP6
VQPVEATTGTVEASNAVAGAPDMQIEIPYIPATQRKTITHEADDSIVVVGQARPKKRKRHLKSTTGGKGSVVSNETLNTSDPRGIPDSDSAPEPQEVQEPFDFSSVPNILDDNPDVELKNEKKPKQQRKGIVLAIRNGLLAYLCDSGKQLLR